MQQAVTARQVVVRGPVGTADLPVAEVGDLLLAVVAVRDPAGTADLRKDRLRAVMELHLLDKGAVTAADSAAEVLAAVAAEASALPAADSLLPAARWGPARGKTSTRRSR
jgi:hypothetical protein